MGAVPGARSQQSREAAGLGETPRTIQKTATSEGEVRRTGQGLVLTRETGARDSRAAHQPGDARGSAIGRAILRECDAATGARVFDLSKITR